MGEFLGLSRPSAESVDVLGGNRVLAGMQPYAARYGGHQFGHWAGQLGDGRAITLAEMIATDGSRQELQLKGAGKTPYSRTADGRAYVTFDGHRSNDDEPYVYVTDDFGDSWKSLRGNLPGPRTRSQK